MQNYFRNFKTLFAVLLAGALTFSCSEDNDIKYPDGPEKNIAQVVTGSTNLSILASAVTKYPDLVSTLSGDGSFTVFAPSNAAFQALLPAIGQTSLNDIPEDVLKSIIQYHVIASAALKSTDLTTGNVNAVNGEAISINVASGVKINTSTNVTVADVEATNGIVHIVDAVLVNPSIRPIVGTIVAPAYFNKNFSTLIAAVKAASPSILTTLLGNGPSNKKLTLFAPTNDAFAAAGITSLPNQATLDAVLTYHVIDDEVLASELPSGSAAITTLNGKFYLSNNGANGVFINAKTQVVATDIQGSNGVVHVINRTLLPPSQTIAAIAVGLSTGSAPQFTQLVAALARTSGTDTDLLAAASDETANLTVFAPTDAAFEALYTALGVDGVEEIDLAILTAVLKHHIVPARVFSTDLTNGTASTLNGDITISATNGTIQDGQGNTANLSSNAGLLNVLATNGVIHTIDKVLLPQ
ncbi:MAG: fasciclin domain-containing protein [Cyclobacteriaceae bacterium]